MAEYSGIKQMPHSMEAEQAVLGAVIIKPSLLNDLMGLTEDDFFLEQHRLIYAAIKNLFNENKSIDIVMLLNTVVKDFKLTDYDASKYIKLICEIGSINTSISEYTQVIKEKAMLRRLIDVSGEINKKSFEETEQPKDILDYAEQEIYKIAGGTGNDGFTCIRDILIENYNTFQKIAKDPNSIKGIETKFSQLDNYFVSLGAGDLVIIGARPGAGKTSFVLNIAANVAKADIKAEVAIFSLEMSKEQLVNRMLACEADIDNYTIRTARFTPQQWNDIGHAASRLSETGILIDDTSNIKTIEMKQKLRRLKNLKLVIIDYLQLMQGDGHKDNRVLEIAEITRALKLIAKEFNVPVLLCSQLSRPPKGVAEKRPILSDLRDSGAIEQDADVVMMLYNDNYNKKENTEIRQQQEVIECIIGKNRHGATGTVKFAWLGHLFKFLPIEERLNENG